MGESALDRVCEKYGCAKVVLDPKLHHFDDCFGGSIRMGDLDGAVERTGADGLRVFFRKWFAHADQQGSAA